MSLVYRSIWQDDRSDLCDLALGTFKEWVRTKHGDEFDFYHHADEAPSGQLVVATARSVQSEDDVLRCAEATLTEEQPDQRWMTRLRVMVDAGGAQWLWVDLERVASNVFKRQNIAAPNLVRNLIAEGEKGSGSPRVGITPLVSTVKAVRDVEVAESLVPLLKSPDRRTPVVVFSHDDGLLPGETMARAQTTADIVAGVAPVYVLPPSAQALFENQMGRDLSVWGGAARVYLPGELEPSRHRYLRRDIVERNRREAGTRIAYMLASPIAAQRAPVLYERVRPLLRSRPGRSETELLDLIDQELREKSEEIDELRARVEQRDDRILDLLGDLDQMNTELDTERSRYRQLRWQIEHPAGDGDTVELSLPEAAATLTEAAELCRRHLSHVVLHEDACHDLLELDSAPEGTAWASTSWRGFRALNAYALEAPSFNGGFWQWCEHSDHPDTWPATPKKLSMTESDTVVKNPRLRAARLLPVASTVDPTGWIEMLAHLKIAEGGGSNIPRIYFHDDTAGGGKVHVGFFGPHRFMENTRT
jgi:hypothetical protein